MHAQYRAHPNIANKYPPLCADGSWILVKTLAIQIRVLCAASRPGDAGRAGRLAVESSSAT